MNYVTLGKTDLSCAQISFGGIPLQRGDAANTAEIVDALERHGMNFIDTARAYTVSEEYLGAALTGRREKFILATKSTARDRSGMAGDIDLSLKNLRTDYIDLYQLHNLPLSDLEQAFGPNGAFQSLLEAKAAGKIGHIGATTHSTEVLTLLTGKYADLVETVMFPYNIVELHGHDVLKAARAKGMGVICMKPLAGGNLEDYRLALRFLAASDAIDVSVVGMGDAGEVERNAAAAEQLGPLTEEELAQCEAIRRELGGRFCRRCGYCAPCAAGVNINGCFLMANYLRRYDLADWAKARYDAMPRHAGDCVGCGLCESRCPYELPIREMLREVVQVFGR